MAALGQTIGIMLPGDEVIKVIITAYVLPILRSPAIPLY
ncbi:Protein yciE [Klebsiella pneumoniae IS39]|nr:Protein yciE [Klebsiella pneumoniae IS39]